MEKEKEKWEMYGTKGGCNNESQWGKNKEKYFIKGEEANGKVNTQKKLFLLHIKI